MGQGASIPEGPQSWTLSIKPTKDRSFAHPFCADGLLEFLVKEKSFNEERVRSAIQRVTAAKSKSNQGVSCQGMGKAEVQREEHGRKYRTDRFALSNSTWWGLLPSGSLLGFPSQPTL